MRLMMYTPTVPIEAGGVQAVFHRLSDGLASRGHEVRRVWPIPFPSSPTPAMDDYVPSLDDPPGLGSPHALRETVWMYRRLWSNLRGFRPDVVNVHFVRPGCRAFLRWRRPLGYKVVLTFHGSDALVPMPDDAPHLAKLIRRADAVTAVSPRVAERLSELAGDSGTPVHTICNGIDHAFWSRDADVPRPGGPPLILAVGRLFEVKDHATLVSAMARVHARRPEARLAIVGGGGCEADLRRQVRELGLEAVVELPGQAEIEAVRDWLARASVYVLPSRSEGLPLSLLEAMAAGVPCVATAVGGVPHLAGEQVGEGGGKAAVQLVEPRQPEALARQILALLDDPAAAEALRQRARQRASEFTLNVSLNGYEELLISL